MATQTTIHIGPNSLRRMALRTCYANLHTINNVGELPFELVRELLERIPTANQLVEIESNSPHIRPFTSVVWEKMIRRDYPVEQKSKHYSSRDPSNWSQVYFRYQRDHEEELAKATLVFKNQMGALQAQALEKKSKGVTSVTVRAGAASRPIRGGFRGGRVGPSSALMFSTGSRTKTTSAQGILRKARREATEIGAVKKLNTQSSAIVHGVRGVVHAPAAMLRDRRIASQPALLASRTTTTTTTAAATKGGGHQQHLTLESIEDVGDDHNERDGDVHYVDDDDDDAYHGKVNKHKSVRAEYSDDDDDDDDRHRHRHRHDDTTSNKRGQPPSRHAPPQNTARHRAVPAQPNERSRSTTSVPPHKPASRHTTDRPVHLARESGRTAGGGGAAASRAPADTMPLRTAQPTLSSKDQKPTPSRPSPTTTASSQGLAPLEPHSSAAAPPRKRKVDIFMQPRKKPRT